MQNKTNTLIQRSIILGFALSGLTACNSFNSLVGRDKIDYQSNSKAPTSSLEVPPDLTKLQQDNRYLIPEAKNANTATASTYNTQNKTIVASIAPQTIADMHIERSGNQRWLVTQQKPEVLWEQLKKFWNNSGFVINLESPESGVMETDWAENRAKIASDIIRNTIGKLFESAYSTGERDKFRTRLERAPDGSTEIYISHRGAQEVFSSTDKATTTWTPRASDPELEAEFLSRLMVQLGASADQAKKITTNTQTQPVYAKLIPANQGASSYIGVNDSFDRAWRRVGLALDQVGFTVEDRDRVKGVYYVRYLDQSLDANNKSSSDGFFSRLFSSSPDANKKAQRYQVVIKNVDATSSQVLVLNDQGVSQSATVSEKILSLLVDQLK